MAIRYSKGSFVKGNVPRIKSLTKYLDDLTHKQLHTHIQMITNPNRKYWGINEGKGVDTYGC